MTQEFGSNPDVYKQYKIGGVALKGHEGIDLRAETGTEVIAADDGFAQEVLDQGKVGYGKYIKLIHPWGETVYAHLQSFKIKQGEQAKRGQTIGLADNTGNSSGSHLHFGVRINPYNRADGWGGYVDPAPFLFSGEAESAIPKWLADIINENNEDVNRPEGVIRKWLGAYKDLEGARKAIEGFENERGDLYELLKLKRDEPFPNALQKVTEWRDGYLREADTAKRFTDFVEDIAQAMGTDVRKTDALVKRVEKLQAQTNPDVLSGWQLISLGLSKLVGRG